MKRKSKISLLLTEYRFNHGFTQKEIGDKIGVSQGQISKWEKQKHIPSILREKDIKDKLNDG